MEMHNLIQPENEAEARALQSLLAEHGIAATVISFRDTAYDGLFQSQYGWGVIRVAEADLVEARRIIEEWKGASPENIPWKGDVSGPETK